MRMREHRINKHSSMQTPHKSKSSGSKMTWANAKKMAKIAKNGAPVV